MKLPESWTERLPILEALDEPWEPLAKWALVAWVSFYLLFLYQLAHHSGILPSIDLVLVPVHESGHLLFSYFGQTLSVLGGTFLQLFVPAALAIYFLFRRQIPGVTFCAFIFFEQFLPISIYMGDARSQELPLLTVGDGEWVVHDWNYMFSRLGLLNRDTQIADIVRYAGWLGMLATLAWISWRGLQSTQRRR